MDKINKEKAIKEINDIKSSLKEYSKENKVKGFKVLFDEMKKGIVSKDKEYPMIIYNKNYKTKIEFQEDVADNLIMKMMSDIISEVISDKFNSVISEIFDVIDKIVIDNDELYVENSKGFSNRLSSFDKNDEWSLYAKNMKTGEEKKIEIEKFINETNSRLDSIEGNNEIINSKFIEIDEFVLEVKEFMEEYKKENVLIEKNK